MKSKFFSIEYTSERNGEIADIITSNQITAQTFDEIQQYVIDLANKHHCRGRIRNEYGMRVLDFNYSPVCEGNICFAWENESLLQEFIDHHPNKG